MEMMANRLGLFVRRRRLALHLKQSDLAERMGEDVDTTYVTKVETGRINVPQQPFLGQLARALRVSEIDLLRAAGVITEEPASPGIAEVSPPYDPDDALSRLAAILADLPRQEDVDDLVEYAEWWRGRVQSKTRVVTVPTDGQMPPSFYGESPEHPDHW